MIHLTDRSHIPAPPERVWNWFANLDAHYLEWHERHVSFQNIRGTPVEVGAICLFDTWLGNFRLRMRSRVVEAEPDRYLRHASLFPYSLSNAGGSFTLEPSDGGCDLIAEVWIGYRLPVLGTLLDRFIEKVLPLAELQKHITEEGRNLARLLNSDS